MPQGHLSCVAAGDAAQQLLQLLGAAEPLQVGHQGKGTIALAHPAQSLPASQAHLQQHLFGLACKTRNLSTPLGRELQGLQAGGISILWSVFALGLIVSGIHRGERPLRLVGLVLFAIVGLKVFFADLAHLTAIYRMLALVIMGIIILLGSFIYLKNAEHFDNRSNKEDER